MGALKCSLWDETCWILHLYQALSERNMLSSFPDNFMLALIKEFHHLFLILLRGCSLRNVIHLQHHRKACMRHLLLMRWVIMRKYIHPCSSLAGVIESIGISITSNTWKYLFASCLLTHQPLVYLSVLWITFYSSSIKLGVYSDFR